MKIKIKFVDFWPGFDETNNFFTAILSDSVELSDFPEMLFFSNFGAEHRKFDCFKVFFSSENERPCFFETDIALTFDYNSNSKHFRLPLYLLYMHKYNLALSDKKLGINSVDADDWGSRNFCCMVVSNGKSKMRNSFYKFLSQKERIDSGGIYLNNVGGPVADKLEFIKNYKFVISFENSSYQGYTTEKILEPFIMNCIPVYWGNKRVYLDFNSNSFLNVRGKRDFERTYAQMKHLEKNIDEAILMINNDKINDEREFYDLQKIKSFILNKYITTKKNLLNSLFSKLISHLLNKVKTIKYWIVEFTNSNYR